MKNLNPYDYVGISFWIISVALAATTGFLVIERNSINPKWRLSVSVGALITGIAASHYYYMRQIWVSSGKNPVVYRYIDWFLTVPLQIIEFYLILSIQNDIPFELFYKLLGASVIMILSGYLGETGIIDRMLGFGLGMIAWLYILHQIFYGEAARLKEESEDQNVKDAFDSLKWVVTIGWAIYPVGYLLDNKKMNIVYNLGDLINKILFTLFIWYNANPNFHERFKNYISFFKQD
tara:strand:- start:45 stop:749 length:705 start_codon:yes stop_codon:yes gene_type:complete